MKSFDLFTLKIITLVVVTFLGSVSFIKYFYTKNRNDKVFSYGFYLYSIVSVFIYIVLIIVILNTFLLRKSGYPIPVEWHDYVWLFLIPIGMIQLNIYYYKFLYKKKDIKATNIFKYKG